MVAFAALPKRTLPIEDVGGAVEEEALSSERPPSSVAGVQFIKTVSVLGFEGRKPKEKVWLSFTCQHVPDVFTALVPVAPLVTAMDAICPDEDFDFDFHFKKKKLHLLCPLPLLVDVLEQGGAFRRYERALT